MFKRTYFVSFTSSKRNHWRVHNYYGWTFNIPDIIEDMIKNPKEGSESLDPAEVFVTSFYRVK